jgi:hypothetical protein
MRTKNHLMIHGRTTMTEPQPMAEVIMFNPSLEYLIGLSKLSGRSFNQTMARIIEGLPEADRPQLFVRDDDGSLISAQQVLQEHFAPKPIGFITNQ